MLDLGERHPLAGNLSRVIGQPLRQSDGTLELMIGPR